MLLEAKSLTQSLTGLNQGFSTVILISIKYFKHKPALAFFSQVGEELILFLISYERVALYFPGILLNTSLRCLHALVCVRNSLWKSLVREEHSD